MTRYDFPGGEVFVFASACPISDEAFPVYDINGNEICWLGGFTGNGYCRGARFDQEAKNPTVIYTKP